jgi:hypothetical protein
MWIWIASAATLGVPIFVYALRRKVAKRDSLDVIGILKQDWTRTGNIDFRVEELESASPQVCVLRVEERKILENAMGQDTVQLRWRLATLQDAKEIVVHWNRRQSE